MVSDGRVIGEGNTEEAAIESMVRQVRPLLGKVWVAETFNTSRANSYWWEACVRVGEQPSMDVGGCCRMCEEIMDRAWSALRDGSYHAQWFIRKGWITRAMDVEPDEVMDVYLRRKPRWFRSTGPRRPKPR